jgi:hypothetical protein
MNDRPPRRVLTKVNEGNEELVGTSFPSLPSVSSIIVRTRRRQARSKFSSQRVLCDGKRPKPGANVVQLDDNPSSSQWAINYLVDPGIAPENLVLVSEIATGASEWGKLLPLIKCTVSAAD